MTPHQLKARRRHFGLSLRAFAYFVGKDRTDPRTVRRWESGGQDIPALLETLLDLLATLPEASQRAFVAWRMKGYDRQAAKRAASAGCDGREIKRLADSLADEVD